MDFHKLDAYLDTLEVKGFPMYDIAVVHEGKTVFRKCAGLADADTKRPVGRDTAYYIYSCSKVATCTAALRAVQDGYLSLEDPVSKYMPEAKNMTVREKDGTVRPAKTTLLVWHLFTMTGGFNYHLNVPEVREPVDAGRTSTQEVIRSLLSAPLDFDPGTNYQYSMCHDVLAAVVEVAVGMRFSEWCRKVIFDPLGMNDTFYHVTESQLSRLCDDYNYDLANFRAINRKGGRRKNIYVFGDDYDCGGAGISTTVDSYLPLVTCLSEGGTLGGYTLLSNETMAEIAKSRMCDAARAAFGPERFAGYEYGLIGRVHLRPEISDSSSARGEFGWDGAGNCYFLADPAKRVGIFYATDVHGSPYGYSVVHKAIRECAYEGIFGGKK